MKNYFKPLLVLPVLLVILSATGAPAFRKDRHDGEHAELRAAQQLERVRRVMLPVLRATDHRIAVNDVRLAIVGEAAINAASAGNGRFYVTTGLLRQASDEQLRGGLAHESLMKILPIPPRRRPSARA